MPYACISFYISYIFHSFTAVYELPCTYSVILSNTHIPYVMRTRNIYYKYETFLKKLKEPKHLMAYKTSPEM